MGPMGMLRLFRLGGPKSFKRRITLELLEERIVLDAGVDNLAQDPAGSHVDQADHSGDGQTATPAPDSTGTGHTSAAPVVDSGQEDTSDSNPLGALFHKDLNVILVADSVDIGLLQPSAKGSDSVVIPYSATQATLSDITNTLAQVTASEHQTIDHLAIVSHGAPGRLDLSGSEVFTSSAIEATGAQWAGLGSLLSHDGRIDIYGCDVGKGEVGHILVQALARATGITVWASDDPTGSGGGADWNLEVRSGDSSLPYLIDGSKAGFVGGNLVGPTIVNGSFESNYTGWTMIDHPLVSGWTSTNHLYGWLSTFGIATHNQVVQHGAFLSAIDPSQVTNPYDDFADQLGTLWPGTTGVPQLTPAIEYQPFTVTDGTTVAYLLQNYNANQRLSQVVTFDSGAESLQWDMRYTNHYSKGFCDDGGDPRQTLPDQFLSVSLYDAAGTAFLQDLFKTNPGAPQSIGMTHFTADISAYKGQTVTLMIEVAAENGPLATAFDNFVAHNAPIATGIPNLTVVEDSANSMINLSSYFTDAETTYLTYSIQGNTNPNLFSSVTIGGTNSDQLTLDYGPNMYGTSQITIKAADADPMTSDVTATFTVRVEPVNDAPTAAYSGGDVKAYIGIDNVIVFNGTDMDMPNPGSVSFQLALHTPDPGSATVTASGPVVSDGQGHYTQEWIYHFDTAFPDPEYDLVGYKMVSGAPARYSDSLVEALQYAQDPASVGVAVGDLNGDGWNDLVVAQQGGNLTTYHLSSPSGGHYNGLAQGVAITGALPANAVELGDINHDGLADLIVATDTTNQYFINLGGSFLGFDGGHDLVASGQVTRAIAVADLNGDGWRDVIAATDQGAKVYLNKGAAGSDASRFYDASWLGSSISYAVAVGDISGDGLPDIVVSNQGQESVYYLNQGAGSFSAGSIITGSGGDTRSLALADLNHDNHLDLVVGKYNQTSMYFLNQGNSSGSWLGLDVGHNLSLGNTTALKVADVNGDGWSDIVVGDDAQTNKVYYAQTSGGTWTGFGAPVNLTPTSTFTSAIAVADINGDGWVDMVNLNPNPAGVDNIYFNGTQTSGTAVIYVTDPPAPGGGSTTSAEPVDNLSNGSTDAGVHLSDPYSVTAYGNGFPVFAAVETGDPDDLLKKTLA